MIFTIIAIVFAVQMQMGAVNLPNEDLQYKVMFKWGLINKQAGRATMSLRNDGTGYKAAIYARSEPWADRIYRLRDTLYSDMTNELIPLRYEKIANEKGKYSRDVIEYERSGNTFIGHSTRYRQKKEDKSWTEKKIELSATGTTVDMLSVFYYLRTLDFPSMTAGNTHTINIFSGKTTEFLRIKFEGIKAVEIDDVKHSTYHVSFRFTTADGKKSSDDIDAWISTDARRIPVKLEGSLPIGKIRCLYTGK